MSENLYRSDNCPVVSERPAVSERPVISEHPAVSERPVVRDLHVDEDPEFTETESLCMNCHKNGTTRMLPTRIPFFREVLVSSFRCDECCWSDTSLMPLGDIQDLGVKLTLKVSQPEDFNRQMVIMSSASITIPEIGLDIPPSKGTLTTVEGVLQKTADDLEFNQPARRIMEPELAQKIDDFICRLRSVQLNLDPFTLIVRDTTGNSFVENPMAPQNDNRLTITRFKRTPGENEALGIQESVPEGRHNPNAPRSDTSQHVEWKEEIMTFNVPCPNCKEMTETKMKEVFIPHFKDVIIMATCCDKCGVRENEVKSGGGIEPLARRITLRITDPIDMSRDVLKSEMCALVIPELEFESQCGMVGGKFSTVEGLLNDLKQQLFGTNPFIQGDSADRRQMTKLKEFCDKIDEIIAGERMGTHFILDDPSGNSYIQNIYSPEPDPEMEIVDYQRTHEQMEALGLNDMKVDQD